ncbi:MAG: hypothetical protein U0470_06270 [Anaerolineae bacterium]
MRFEAVASEGAAPGSVSLPDDDAAPLPTAPAGLGLGDIGDGGTLAGWGIVALGLVILGLWTGATMRARAPSTGDDDADGADDRSAEADAARDHGAAAGEADAASDRLAADESDADAQAESERSGAPLTPAAPPSPTKPHPAPGRAAHAQRRRHGR